MTDRDANDAATPALDWLFGLQRFGVKPGLERARALLTALELPAPGTRVVLVAGTNGKGTVTRLVSAALTAAGNVTGSFFSPHLERVGERARIDGEDSGTVEMENAVASVRPAAEELGCTFFEVAVAAALHRFREAGASWVVMECGLGGRFDATNALDPALSAVTGVALDHQAVLGPTLAAIADDKAGVLREGVPAVTGADGEALQVIEQVAGRVGAPLLALGRDFVAEVHHSGWDGLRLTVAPASGTVDGLPLTLSTPLVGRHQAANVAVAAVCALRLGVSPGAIAEAFGTTRWPGRLERFDLDRAWVLDGAHNRQASHALAASVAGLGTPPAAVVLGVSADKDVAGVLAPLVDMGAPIVATKASNSPRALQPEVIASIARALGAAHVHEADGPAQALEVARALTSGGDMVLVAGSLFLVGEVRTRLRGASPEGRQRWQ